jgi:hypothetical protein
VDLYVAGVNHNQLLHNNGDGTFTDVTVKAGVEGTLPGRGKAWAVTAGWFDYDNDGLLDLLVVNYLDYDIRTAPQCHFETVTIYCSPDDFHPLPNILYHNNGDGTFTDVSQSSRIARYAGKGMGVAFADYDNDGFVDVFLSNDTFPNYLLHNNGDGTFTDVALVAGVAFTGSGKTVAGMGTDFRDLNNDGKPDIFHTAMFGDTFPLYRNLGGGQFEDATYTAGLGFTSQLTGWSVGAFDFDNDGYKDLFSANAAILDNSANVQHQPFKLPNGLFRNRGGFAFEDLSATAGADFALPEAHRGAAFGDLNNDGKIDAVVTVLDGPPQILMNRSANQNHWIILQLTGTKSNRDGLGTKVKITTAHGVQYNTATTAVGYNSASDKRVYFGLGPSGMIDKIELTWPSGTRQTLVNIRANRILSVKEAQ